MVYIVGLGNPGPEYERTRHNVGFMVVDHLAGTVRCGAFAAQGSLLAARARVGGREAVLVKPRTFMNHSGAAVRQLLARDPDATPGEIVLVYDDLDLPLGRIRIRTGGSHGGHKGVLSVIEAAGTPEVSRVRLGIRPLEGRAPDPIEFVLSPFAAEEEALALDMVRRGAEALVLILTEGIRKSMNVFNRQAPEGDEPEEPAEP